MSTENIVEILIGCITAFTAITTTVMNLLFSRRQKRLGIKEAEKIKQLDEIASLRGGVRTILRFYLSQIYKSSVSNGFISIEDLSSADEIYKSYHELGGNSTGTMLYKKLRNMPNIKNEMKINSEREIKNESFGLYN